MRACVFDEWIIEGIHTVDSILSMFLFKLILSSKILCTLRCVTFINSTTSYDKRNACNRYGCWLSLMFIIFFLSILKKIAGKHWVKEEEESFSHIKFNDGNSMVMTKINVTKQNKANKMWACGQNWWRSRKKAYVDDKSWRHSLPELNENSSFVFLRLRSVEIVIYDIYLCMSTAHHSHRPFKPFSIVTTSHIIQFTQRHGFPRQLAVLCARLIYLSFYAALWFYYYYLSHKSHHLLNWN